MLADAIARALDAAFAALGESATYEPAGGDAVEVTVRWRSPDAIAEGELATRAVTVAHVAEVRASEVAAPGEGDTLACGGTVYEVAAPPRAQDPRRLIWTLPMRVRP